MFKTDNMTDGASFARNHLQKYGWEEGKGLGRTESGITDAIKPKLKFDTAGVGHNAGDQFSFHWWDHVFNKAAKNIEVKNSDEGVSVKQRGKKDNLISNKKTTTQVKSKALMYGSFVKCGIMKPGGLISKDEQPSSSSSSEDSDDDDLPPDTYEGNDERLFKACGGRTAHKGARHGLHLSGKLKRIEEQDNLHGSRKASPSIIRAEKESLSQEVEISEGQIKKKKKKKRSKAERSEVAEDEERCIPGSDGEDNSSQEHAPVVDGGDRIAADEEGRAISKKRKKKQKRNKERVDGEESPDASQVLNEDNDQSMTNVDTVLSTEREVSETVGSKKAKKSKKRKHQNLESDLNEEEENLCSGEDKEEADAEQIALLKKKKKKSKRKGDDVIEQDACFSPSEDRVTTESCVDEQRKKKKLKKQKKAKDHI